MTEHERVEPFTGRSSAMRAENRWLGAEDIYGFGDVTVTITAVLHYRNVKFEGGRAVPELFALQFEGKTKQLILSPTKRRPLVVAWGTDVKAWIGKQIVLYVDTDVRKPGTSNEKTWGIRVRDVKANQAAKRTQPKSTPPAATSQPDKLAQWIGGLATLSSAASCAEFRESILPSCPAHLRAEVEKALLARESTLSQLTEEQNATDNDADRHEADRNEGGTEDDS